MSKWIKAFFFQFTEIENIRETHFFSLKTNKWHNKWTAKCGGRRCLSICSLCGEILLFYSKCLNVKQVTKPMSNERQEMKYIACRMSHVQYRYNSKHILVVFYTWKAPTVPQNSYTYHTFHVNIKQWAKRR